MRSIAEQTDTELGGAMSVLVRQKRDHVELDHLLHGLGRTSGEEQDDVLQRMNRLVFGHAFAEEAVLWPTLRRLLPDGEALTRQVEQEHQEVNELVVALEQAGHGPPGNVLSALPLSAIDRSRDHLDRAARRSRGPDRQRLRATSGVLARIAGAVEQLPPMKRGEHPSTQRSG
jgi:hypothetical protein